jgi:ribosomal protein S18 acetylase RimI-like enzyme
LEVAMQINVRRAVPEDAGSISGIWEIICAERVFTAVSQPFSPQQEQEYILSLSEREGIFVAEVNEQIIGFQALDLWAKYTDSFDHVGTMGSFVLPEWRGKGIGKRMANHTLVFARANDYEKIVVYVRAGNLGARAFYRSLGFEQKGILTKQVKIDGKYEDEVFMEMFL